jgi:hypothetical protein
LVTGGLILTDESKENEKVEVCDLEDPAKPLERVELTDRDVSVFRFVHEHRYLAYNQIRRAFWPNRSVPANACYQRVERLVNSGYLEKSRSSRKGMHIYLATGKSFQVLKEQGMNSDVPLYKPSTKFDFAITHDLNVANTRILFRRLGLDSWTSERVLRERDHLAHVPDGVLNVRGKKVAIEFENHLTKSKARYQQLFRDYGAQSDFLVVLVIIDGDTKDWLIQTLDYDARKIWIATYQELMKEKGEAIFENKRARFKLSHLL